MWAVDINTKITSPARTIYAGVDLDETLDRCWETYGQFLHERYNDQKMQQQTYNSLFTIWRKIRVNPGWCSAYTAGRNPNDIVIEFRQMSNKEIQLAEQQGADIFWDERPVQQVESAVEIQSLDELLLGART